MRDDRLRRLEREWRETGDLALEEAWLRERARTGDPYGFGRHKTQLPAVRAVLDAAERASRHDRPLVIVGPPNSGRGTLAHAIHLASRRAEGRFRACHGSHAIAELFGYEQGSWVAGDGVELGLTEACAGGTVLVSISELLSEDHQALLRRCLAEGVTRRLGSVELRPLEARLVFQVSDLEHLGGVTLTLEELGAEMLFWPALSARMADLGLALAELDTQGLNCGPRLRELLENHDWPGGLRELEELVYTARLLRGRGIIPAVLDRDAFQTRALRLLLAPLANAKTPPEASSEGA